MANTGTSRRRFLNVLTSLVLAALALLGAVPALVYLWAPLRKKRGADVAGAPFLDAGPVADVSADGWRLLSLEMTHEDGWKKTRVRHAAWARRTGEGEEDVSVLSSICPHLGCPINWHPDQSQFVCPCHGALFDAEGRRTAGPPPRDMDPLKLEVREGRLWVRWQDFKIGVGERVPVNV
jgi:Rieske Fe-S protein